MFCKVCGAELRPDVDFCIKCGEKVPKKKEESEAPAQEEAVEQSVQQSQQVQQAQPVLQAAPIYNVSKEAVSSSKNWLLIGLICNIVNMIPYINILMFIPSIICTILGMNKVVNLLKDLEDNEAQKFFKGTKLLRLNYIICIILACVMFVFGIIFVIIIAATSQNSDPDVIAAVFTGGLVLVAIVFTIYYYGILLWALVHWIRLNDFLGKLAR